MFRAAYVKPCSVYTAYSMRVTEKMEPIPHSGQGANLLQGNLSH